MGEKFTELYVNIQCELKKLVGVVSEIVSGEVDDSTVTVPGVEIDVLENEYYSPIYLSAKQTDFIYYPYMVEVVSLEEMDLANYLSIVSDIMKGLQRQKADVVAACDWEDQLPGGGNLAGKTD